MSEDDAGCSLCGLGHLCSNRASDEAKLIVPYVVCKPFFGLLNKNCCINFGKDDRNSCFIDASELEKIDDSYIVRINQVNLRDGVFWVTLRDCERNEHREFPVQAWEMHYKFVPPAEFEKDLRV